MKKLLVTAIGAAAAFGAVAGTISTQRFESVTGELPLPKTTSELNALAGTTDQTPYWVGDDLTNTYKVVAVSPAPTSYPFEAAPTKGLEVKTVFGNPLTRNAVAGGTATPIPATGLYFDSVVKFTVCEDEPDQTYDNAKIVMWLQEKLDGETVIGTNLIVRAGYLSKPDATIISTPTNYVCDLPGDFDVEKWYRVTIKAMANITTGGVPVPGFAIYINPSISATKPIWGVGCLTAPKWDATFSSAVQLTEAASLLETNFGCVFPTMDLTSGAVTTLTSAGFDGTGWITDICFTDVAPAYAEDMEKEKAGVKIGTADEIPFGKLSDAIAVVNNPENAGKDITLTLKMGMSLDSTLAFAASANLTLDFAGVILTNNSANAAISNTGRLTITDSTGNGGIYCTSTGPAISDTGRGAFAITGGNFWGHVVLAEGEDAYEGRISGGAYMAPDDFEAFPDCLPSGKKFASTASSETGLYEIVDIVNYTITFNANGGEGSMAAMTVEDGVATNLTANAFTRAGYTFAGWATSDIGDVVYADAGAITANDNVTLYAKWNANTYTIKFAYGEGLVNTGTVANVAYNTMPSADSAWEADITGMAFTGWSPTIVAATADAVYTAQYSAKTYTVTFYTNSVKYAEAEYTYGDAGSYSAPADPSVSGYTFGGWYTDNGTFETAFVFSANVADNTQVAYAKLTSDGPTPIDPGSATPQTIVTADSEDNAIKAATITPPAGVDAAEYKANFDFSAKDNGDGTYTVTMTGIKDTVTEGAASTAVAEVLSAATGESGDVTIPAGLYYKITTMTALDDKSPTVLKPSTPSTGKVNVTKPGTDKGFIKVELGTKAFE